MISFAVTAHEESQKGDYTWIHNCVETASKIPEVDEICVLDDCSSDFAGLKKSIGGVPKVVLHRNHENLGVLGNKLEVIRRCGNHQPDVWVQLCDSDDEMIQEHFDKLLSLRPWQTDTLYCNSYGQPRFDYRSLVGSYRLSNYLKVLDNKWSGCQINTGNHFFHRKTFSKLFLNYEQERLSILQNLFGAERVDSDWSYWRKVHDGADSAFYNTRWLLAGNQLEIVAGLEYEHRYNATPTGAYYNSPPEKGKLLEVYLDELRNHPKRHHK